MAMLVAGLLFVSNQARESAKIQLAQSTLALLDTALEQYYDETHTYPPDVNYTSGGTNFPARNLQYVLSFSGNASAGPSGGADYIAGSYDAQSIEVLYYYLNRLPQSREVLSKLDNSVVSSKAPKFDASNKPLASKPSDPNLVITIEGVSISFFRVVDPWNVPLQYVRRRINNNIENTGFPLIRSAGPDKRFGTADDIVNRKN